MATNKILSEKEIEEVLKIYKENLKDETSYLTDSQLINLLGKKVPHKELFRKKLRNARKAGKIPGYETVSRYGTRKISGDTKTLASQVSKHRKLSRRALTQARLNLIKKIFDEKITPGKFITSIEVIEALPTELKVSRQGFLDLVRRNAHYFEKYQAVQGKGFTLREDELSHEVDRAVEAGKFFASKKTNAIEILRKVNSAQLQLIQLQSIVITSTETPNLAFMKEFSLLQFELATICSLLESLVDSKK